MAPENSSDVTRESCSGPTPSHALSRRNFLGTAGCVSAAVALALGTRGASAGALLISSASRPAVAPALAAILSFHLDQPYIDLSGTAEPFVPPAGARSGAPLAALSDEVLARYYGII